MPKRTEGKLKISHRLVLARICKSRCALSEFASEGMRQRVIDLAMCEPPYVDIRGEELFATDAGRAALKDTNQ